MQEAEGSVANRRESQWSHYNLLWNTKRFQDNLETSAWMEPSRGISFKGESGEEEEEGKKQFIASSFFFFDEADETW